MRPREDKVSRIERNKSTASEQWSVLSESASWKTGKHIIPLKCYQWDGFFDTKITLMVWMR